MITRKTLHRVCICVIHRTRENGKSNINLKKPVIAHDEDDNTISEEKIKIVADVSINKRRRNVSLII